MRTPEGAVKAACKKLFDKYNAKYVMPMGTGYGVVGVSDFVACVNGKFLAVETKAKNNKTTPLQERFLSEVTKAGGIALVIREDTLDILEQVLKDCHE